MLLLGRQTAQQICILPCEQMAACAIECTAQYQEDVVLGLHNLQQLNDAAMSQAAQDADFPLYPPLVYCLLQANMIVK